MLPWVFYKDEGQRLAHVPNHMAEHSEKELMRVRNAVLKLRADAYQHINEVRDGGGVLQ